MDHSTRRSEVEAFYRDYLRVCNDHRFEDLGPFVADDVVVNGEPRGLDGYGAALRSVIRGFPDYHWDLRHLVVDDEWFAAHLATTGTHRGPLLGLEPTGRTAGTHEFAVYRTSGGRIAEVWGTADDLALRARLLDDGG
ncbi:ester cyclase [Jiangella rhizosphaerae]|uniref:Ester cyclase n=1 Tax=Jiangella rhizosphaerae TaxID=2293569 RepID=A0A418KW71_9ACTN|nr:ester cyclase [Jiangella rhizosphaerae]RIQ35653.1 ester cyclase [Jiangella rhizosphaerae]